MLRYTVTVVTSMVKTDQTKRETRSIREVTTEGSKLLSLMKVQNEFVRFNLCRKYDRHQYLRNFKVLQQSFTYVISV